jgi:hypothetical protein
LWDTLSLKGFQCPTPRRLPVRRFGAGDDLQSGELRNTACGCGFRAACPSPDRPDRIAGQVVSREELLKLWQLTLSSISIRLNNAVARIRKVLGDSSDASLHRTFPGAAIKTSRSFSRPSASDRTSNCRVECRPRHKITLQTRPCGSTNEIKSSSRAAGTAGWN